jgi:hypothetical protein
MVEGSVDVSDSEIDGETGAFADEAAVADGAGNVDNAPFVAACVGTGALPLPPWGFFLPLPRMIVSSTLLALALYMAIVGARLLVDNEDCRQMAMIDGAHCTTETQRMR